MSESVTRCVNFKWPFLDYPSYFDKMIRGILEGLLGVHWDALGIS